ncbi:MAG: ATP-grasp domain-containing protein [Vicinamibacterales bacterium]
MAAARVLIAGVSARAAAASAARAGFAATMLDAFADRDLPQSVRGLSLPRDFGVPFSAGAAARAARDIPCDAVVYLSSFENHPDAVSALAAGRRLWGNAPAVLRRVRNPRLLMRALRQRGIPAPAVIVNANASNAPPSLCAHSSDAQGRVAVRPDGSVLAGRSALADRPGEASPKLAGGNPRRAKAGPNAPNEWLIKPLASGGGHGVRQWMEADPESRIPDPAGGIRPPRGCYLQQRVEGVPGSGVFVAAGGRAVPLGVSRQLVGEPAFGATGFRYCGNILAGAGDTQFGDDELIVPAACALAAAMAEAFDLVGVNGIDFMAHEGVPYPIEVNPRWCGSMELVETAYGISVFGTHAEACAAGTLPRFDLTQARQGTGAVGKAIVFAREDVAVGDTNPWLADATVHDVPHPGEHIAAGRPVCTVYAEAADAAACHAALVARAERVYAELAEWRR